LGGATIRKTIFACLYVEKIFSRTRWTISIKLGEFKIVQIKGQVLFKREIITKMEKWGWVI
jgi:hypothetical protein